MRRNEYLALKHAVKRHLLEQACEAVASGRLPESEVLFDRAIQKEIEIMLVSQDPSGSVVDFYDPSRGFCLTTKPVSGIVLLLANN